MQPTYKTPNEAVADIFNKHIEVLPDNLPPSIKDKAGQISNYDDLVYFLRDEAKMPQDIAESAASVALFSGLEKLGINPSEWKFTVDPREMRTKFYGPEQWENARRFNATWSDVAQVALIAASVFGLATMIGAVTISGATLASAGVAIRAGLGWKAVSEIVKLGALRGIKWLGIPSFFAWMGEKIANYANTQLSTTGDLEGYLLQASAKAEQQRGGMGTGGTGSGSAYAQVPKTRATTYSTAKPKLFTGIIFNGQVGNYEQFVRAVDDAITSDEDLKNDIEINLTKYISKIPNNLSYSIQIKNSPADELGIPRSGTWATLSIYLTNQFHKRVFIDEILLGPVDPFVYYPESQRVESLQYEVPKLLKFDSLHPMDKYTGQERLVDTAGNVITDVLKDGTRAVAGASVMTPATPTLADVSLGQEKAVPNSISAEGVFQHNQPPLFATLYKNTGTEILSFNPYDELTSAEEKQRLSQDSGKFFGNEQKLRDKGVNTGQIRAVQFLDLEGVGKFPMRQANFAEFFGSVQTSVGFPKQVHVVANKLNVRSQPTSQSATAGSQQLTKGDIFTAVALIEGESVNGNNKWYKSSRGNFVWSGGTSTEARSVAQKVQEKRQSVDYALLANWPAEAVPAPDFEIPKAGTFYIPKARDFKIPGPADFDLFHKDI